MAFAILMVALGIFIGMVFCLFQVIKLEKRQNKTIDEILDIDKK